MSELYVPETYHTYATEYVMEHSKCGVFLDMGLGKTGAVLTAITRLLKLNRWLEPPKKILVVAPLRVAEMTWPDEIEKWDHTKHLRYSVMTGAAAKRQKALNKQADIYLINFANLPWLVGALKGWWPFDMVVVDESSKLKNQDTLVFKSMKMVAPAVNRLVLMSGTPMSQGYIDLWSQIFLLDKGQRLGDKITQYRKKYFMKNDSGYGYTLKDEVYGERISKAIGDICVSMRQKDYLTLPDRITRRIELKMPDDLRTRYKQFEKDKVMELVKQDKQITAFNAAALSTKLLQFANGAVYDNEETREWHEVHNLKIDALRDILETSTGHPVLVVYNFQHDAERIMQHLKEFKPVLMKKREHFEAWNRREIACGLIHPDSAGHGLNLQAGGNIIAKFGHTWKTEADQQVIKRLERRGQTEAVIVHDIIVKGTVDAKVVSRLEENMNDEAAMMEAIKAVIAEHAPLFKVAPPEEDEDSRPWDGPLDGPMKGLYVSKDEEPKRGLSRWE